MDLLVTFRELTWELFDDETYRVEPESPPFDNPGGFLHFEDLTRDGRYFLLKAPSVPSPAIWIQRVGVPEERRVVLAAGPNSAVQPPLRALRPGHEC